VCTGLLIGGATIAGATQDRQHDVPSSTTVLYGMKPDALA
jgi:hypothetical protein